MKKLIFLAMLTVLIFIGCEDTINVTGPSSDGIELEWIYATDNMMDELHYTHDDQIAIVNTHYSGEFLYGIKEICEVTGSIYSNWRLYDLIKCDTIKLFIYGSQNSYFTYSYDTLPDITFTMNLILNYYIWKEK